MRKEYQTTILFFVILAIVIAIFVGLIAYGEKTVTKEYSLSELNAGIYGIYTVVSSNVPANNYEMITLCVDGQIHTFKGHVNIRYSNSDYRLILEDKNLVYADVMNVYVPYGSIEYSANVGVGK